MELINNRRLEAQADPGKV